MEGIRVWRVRTGVTLVEVAVVVNGDRLQCVFLTSRKPLRYVGVFLDRHIGSAQRINRQAYRRRLVPVELIEEARERALSALVEFDGGQPTERGPKPVRRLLADPDAEFQGRIRWLALPRSIEALRRGIGASWQIGPVRRGISAEEPPIAYLGTPTAALLVLGSRWLRSGFLGAWAASLSSTL